MENLIQQVRENLEDQEVLIVDNNKKSVLGFTGLFVTREQFTLGKIIMNNDTKICKVWCECDLSNTSKVKVLKLIVHPDYQCNETLQNRINDLKPYLCEIQHIKKENQHKVNTLGIEMSGNEDNATWKIHGINESDSKQNMKLETCKTHYDGGVYTWESDVVDLIDEIETEAFNYVFAGAEAIISMGLDNANDSEQSEEKTEDVTHEEVD